MQVRRGSSLTTGIYFLLCRHRGSTTAWLKLCAAGITAAALRRLTSTGFAASSGSTTALMRANSAEQDLNRFLLLPDGQVKVDVAQRFELARRWQKWQQSV